MKSRPTGIPCFECGERSGIDCAGRRPDEGTRCKVCMEKFMKQMGVAEESMEQDKDFLCRLPDTIEKIVRELGLPAYLVNPQTLNHLPNKDPIVQLVVQRP